MATYKTGQDILNASLGDYHQQGFRLYACARGMLALNYKDEPIRTFSLTGATIIAIREACQEYLKTGRAW
ncbi:hypothetical protein ES704_01947 [subsurface metagenome]|jgi:hypothetical protein